MLSPEVIVIPVQNPCFSPDADLVGFVDAFPLRHQSGYELRYLVANLLRHQVADLVGDVLQDLY